MEGNLGHGGDKTLILCRLDEIEDGGAKGFDLGPGKDPRDIFLVRRGSMVFAFVNSCPHVGTPLDWQPDRFLTADGSQILCATHGALFRIEDGHCLAGPCAGKALQALAVRIDGQGDVILD